MNARNIYALQVIVGLCLLCQGPVILKAQSTDFLNAARLHLEKQRTAWGLTSGDIADLQLNDQYRSRHNGVTHLYLQQRHQGIPVHNAISGVHLRPDGEVGFATNRFVDSLAQKINAIEPLLSAEAALRAAAGHLGIALSAPPRRIDTAAEQRYLFSGAGFAQNDVPVELVYQYFPDTDRARLAWSLSLNPIGSSDYWSLRIDAVTGAMLEKDNWTLYCSFGHHHAHSPAHACRSGAMPAPRPPLVTDGATYNVWPLPLESPIHGERELVVNPADPLASPFGWHDTDGAEGFEYRITRGNNVHAYLDLADVNFSSDDEPDGGDALLFDFPYDPAAEPSENQEISVTQLFYLNNAMHDFAYAYGFDEAAGNFQENTYGNDGNGGDYVIAEAQDGYGAGENINNANFSTPPDGGNGRMQMYLWNRVGGELLTVVAPEAISGSYLTGTASYGPPVSETPVTGEVAEAFDETQAPSLACEPIVNADAVAGKIALIDRGSCFFEQKTANAEAAGAIAVIICNYDNAVVGMGGVAEVPNPGIPSVMLRSTDCQLIRQRIAEGVVATLQLPPGSSGPEFTDGTLDNGIIAHEYGHGISNRLTGGPSAASCLTNDEQMGEGWSDFFTLITTARPGDTGEMPRGIGNFATRAGVNGAGIRRFPYATDPAVNNQVYDDVIATSAPHPLGEVWTSLLWDLYWRLVEEYGWDEDLYYGAGGNNIAIQLVMDGMKLQACTPGFIDGRDAILAADELLYDGLHQCLIWEVFARRGFGINAQQNSPFDRTDGVQDFFAPPTCIKELKIAKTVTANIEAGEEIDVELVVTNHKETAVSGVVVTDPIPAGAAFVAGSYSGEAELTTEGGLLIFEIGEIASGASVNLKYTLASSEALVSVRQFYDDMETGDANWVFLPLSESLSIWELGFTTQANSGSFAWFVPATPDESDQVLQLAEPVVPSGNQPVLRFFHRYLTDPVLDGGIVQVSTDGGLAWEDLGDLMFKNPYRGQLNYRTFSIPDLEGFWGDSGGMVDTYVDLSPYAGQEVLLRFRFGTELEEEGVPGLGGWYVDDVEFFDLVNYNSEACVSSDQGDQACAAAPHRGTIVEPGTVSGAEPVTPGKPQVKIFPNPAGEWINISLNSPQAGTLQIELFRPDGQWLQQRERPLLSGPQTIPFSIGDLPGGVYLLRLRTPQGTIVKRLTVR